MTEPGRLPKQATTLPSGRLPCMALDHEPLDVYRRGLEFLVLAERVIQAWPKGRSHLADQLTRASISVVLDVAEGAGKFSKGDKRRYDLAARGSATESAALMDVYLRLELTSEVEHAPASRCSSAFARDAGETRAKLRRPKNSGSVTGSDAHTGYAPWARSLRRWRVRAPAGRRAGSPEAAPRRR